MMRIMLTGCALAVCLLAGMQTVFARYEGPWCAHRNLGRGFIENRCDMPSYEACRQEINSSPGTWCTQNPYFVPANAAPLPRKAKRRHL
ncbi:unnamed protein product [Phaeothamnion confervicola]